MDRPEEIVEILKSIAPELAKVQAGELAIIDAAAQIMDLYKEEQMALELFGDIIKGMGVNFGRQEAGVSAPVQDIMIELQDGDYNTDGYVGESPKLPVGELIIPLEDYKASCGCDHCTCDAEEVVLDGPEDCPCYDCLCDRPEDDEYSICDNCTCNIGDEDDSTEKDCDN